VQCVCLLPLAVAKQPENAVASSWRASVPPPFHPRHPQSSVQNGISVSVWALPWVPEPCLPASALLLVTLPEPRVLWASDLAQVPSPPSNAAPNKLERSVDDRSAIPNASGSLPYSTRVLWRYAVVAFSRGSRSPDKSHSPGVRNVAPAQREYEPLLDDLAVQAHRAPVVLS